MRRQCVPGASPFFARAPGTKLRSTLLFKMAKVTLIDLGYCKVDRFLTFLRLAPALNLDLKTGAPPQ